jgi:hypothetical protein
MRNWNMEPQDGPIAIIEAAMKADLTNTKVNHNSNRVVFNSYGDEVIL